MCGYDQPWTWIIYTRSRNCVLWIFSLFRAWCITFLVIGLSTIKTTLKIRVIKSGGLVAAVSILLMCCCCLIIWLMKVWLSETVSSVSYFWIIRFNWTGQKMTDLAWMITFLFTNYMRSFLYYRSWRTTLPWSKYDVLSFSTSLLNPIYLSILPATTSKSLSLRQKFPLDALLSSTLILLHVVAGLDWQIYKKQYMTCMKDWWDLSFRTKISASSSSFRSLQF